MGKVRPCAAGGAGFRNVAGIGAGKRKSGLWDTSAWPSTNDGLTEGPLP
jgi:hypothetical protein